MEPRHDIINKMAPRILIFSVLVFTLLFRQTAFAADYTIAPVVIDEKAQVRDIIKESVTLTNTTSHLLTLYPTVDNIISGQDGGIEKFTDPSDEDKTASLANWIEIPRGAIDLQPGEQKLIVFSIRVNPNAKAGEYHARIAFPNGNTRLEAESAIDRSPSLTVNVEVTERMVELLQLKKFISDKSLLLYLPGNFTYVIENAGTQDMVPHGDIIIYDNSGKEVVAVPVNSDGRKIQPGGVAEFKATVEKEGLFGRYKAFLNVQYGDTHRASIHDSVFFTVLPWKPLAAGLAVLSVMVAGFVKLARRRRRKTSRPDPNSYGVTRPVVFASQVMAPARVERASASARVITLASAPKAVIPVQTEEQPVHPPTQIPAKAHNRHVMDLRQFKR